MSQGEEGKGNEAYAYPGKVDQMKEQKCQDLMITEVVGCGINGDKEVGRSV